MLIRAIISTSAKTDQEYCKVIKQRQIFSLAAMVLGIVTLAMGVYFTITGDVFLSDFFAGFYCGVGAGILVGSFLGYMHCRSLLKNEKKLHAKRLAENDERNQAILAKTLFMTSLILIIILYVAMIVSGLFSAVVFQLLLGIVVIYFLIFLLCYSYFRKKL